MQNYQLLEYLGKGISSFELTRIIVQSNINITHGEKVVLLILISRMNNLWECFPSYRSIAENAICSERSVATHIKGLVDKGLIKIVPSTFKSNTYTVGNNLASYLCQLNQNQVLVSV